jgi:hypothetical protein
MLRAGKWETETTGNFDVHLVVDDESVGARETKTSKDAVDLMESLRDGLGSQHRAQFEAALAG